MMVAALVVLSLFAALAIVVVTHWEQGVNEHEAPTLDTRNHLDD